VAGDPSTRSVHVLDLQGENMTVSRRARAVNRVTTVCYPDGTTAGFIVRGWHPGQLPIGPFVSYELAIRAALENTAGLVLGQARRHHAP
jgi:hypothetical protein